jgi:6-pyruvoyltetrahydropterin/6-carboxytetrahydropterin synthase
MKYTITKHYGADRGFSVCFRQWKATGSHCSFLHGYALSFTFMFSGPRDHRGWVLDFGSLSWLETWLRENFDHTTLIAKDDPQLVHFQEMHRNGTIDLRVLDEVGCEAFAKYIFEKVAPKMENEVRLDSVLVSEHPANHAGVFADEVVSR